MNLTKNSYEDNIKNVKFLEFYFKETSLKLKIDLQTFRDPFTVKGNKNTLTKKYFK